MTTGSRDRLRQMLHSNALASSSCGSVLVPDSFIAFARRAACSSSDKEGAPAGASAAAKEAMLPASTAAMVGGSLRLSLAR